MKRIFITLIILAASTLFTAEAQEYKPEWQQVDTMTVVRTKAERRLAFVEKTDVVPKSIFVETGGAGLNFLSFNFETRFARQLNGLGLRVGVSFMGGDSSGVATLPAQLNYLLGNRGRYFEMGAGATLFHGYSDLFSSKRYDGDNRKETYTKLIGTLTFGYRYQPVKGGFTFRAGFAPIFTTKEDGEGFIFIPYIPYLSLGYSF